MYRGCMNIKGHTDMWGYMDLRRVYRCMGAPRCRRVYGCTGEFTNVWGSMDVLEDIQMYEGCTGVYKGTYRCMGVYGCMRGHMDIWGMYRDIGVVWPYGGTYRCPQSDRHTNMPAN